MKIKVLEALAENGWAELCRNELFIPADDFLDCPRYKEIYSV